jgi:Dolichyl-phosphate-mannose-protein mannosyltransferase
LPHRSRTATKPKAPDESLPRERTWSVYATVVAMLLWYFGSAVSAISQKCTTFDETLHLTAGYSSWKFHDFRMQPENGNLPQRWAAIPLLFRTTHFPNFDQLVWRKSAVVQVGDQFFYDVGNNADAMLRGGRAMMALFGVALGALVFFWARSLMGTGPALVSLGLYAFCPTMLANGPLITSDMAAALFFSASMFCIWRVLHHVNWQNLMIGSLVTGCLFVSKFSAPLIGLMGALLVAIQLISRQPTVVSFGGKIWEVHRRSRRLLIHLATIAVHAAVLWIVIWAFFDFRYDMLAETKIVTNQTVNQWSWISHFFRGMSCLANRGGSSL